MIDFKTAKELLDLGLPVFPVKVYWSKEKNKFEKQPMVSWAPYQYRLPTEEELHQWFDKPVYNAIGCSTGKLSGIVAIDIDDPESVDRFPSSVVSQTISGRQHHLFKWTREIRNLEAINGEPLDFRGDGGFIVLPGSSCDGKAYSWVKRDFAKLESLPKEFLDLISDSEKRAGQPFKLSEFVSVKQGARDGRLFKLGCSLLVRKYNKSEVLFTLQEVNRTYQPPLTDAEVFMKFNQAIKYSQKNGFSKFLKTLGV